MSSFGARSGAGRAGRGDAKTQYVCRDCGAASPMSLLRRLRGSFNTISVALPRSISYCPSMRRAKFSSSIATSSSQLPIQLARLRLLDPTRAQRPSATAVFA